MSYEKQAKHCEDGSLDKLEIWSDAKMQQPASPAQVHNTVQSKMKAHSDALLAKPQIVLDFRNNSCSTFLILLNLLHS